MSSNMIKAYSIAYDSEAVRKLDMSEREEEIAEHLHELIPEQRFVKAELPVFDESAPEGEFVPGLAAENVSEFVPEETTAEMSEQEIEAMRAQIREELMAEMQQNAEALIADARKQADEVIAKAKEEAELAKASIFQLASGQGYEEGLNRAKQEEKRVTEELEAEKLKVQQEYERRVSELEPAFVKIMVELVKKLTNVSYENHKEVLIYLIEQGIASAGRDSNFTIWLNPEDLQRIDELGSELQSRYQDKLSLDFKADDTLSKGDCILENANRRIDCGLGTQMQGLLDSLALLSEQPD